MFRVVFCCMFLLNFIMTWYRKLIDIMKNFIDTKIPKKIQKHYKNINKSSNSGTKLTFFPHAYLNKQSTQDGKYKLSTPQLQRIKFNYLYQKNDGTYTNKHNTYYTLPTINTYYNVVTAPTATVTTTATEIDLIKLKDSKGNVISNFLPPVYDQGGYGTCTANATAFVWCFLKIASTKNNIFTRLTSLPSRSSIYYAARAISGLLIETTDSTNKTVSKRIYVDEGTDPSLFGSVFTRSGNSDNTSRQGGSFREKTTTYYYYGGQVITGFCPEEKWKYPADSTYTVNSSSDPYPYCDPYFLLYNPASPGGEYDSQPLVPTNSPLATIQKAVDTKVAAIQNSTKDIAGLYSILPNNTIFTMSLSKLTTVAMPPSQQNQMLTSAFYKTLQQGLPMLLGFNVYNSFMNTPKSGIVPAISGSLLGGHCIAVVGWILLNGLYYVKCINSWSASWGDKGYCYFSLSMFTDKRLDCSLYAFISAN